MTISTQATTYLPSADCPCVVLLLILLCHLLFLWKLASQKYFSSSNLSQTALFLIDRATSEHHWCRLISCFTCNFTAIPLLHFSEDFFFFDFECGYFLIYFLYQTGTAYYPYLHIQRSTEHLCVSSSNHDFVKKPIKHNPSESTQTCFLDAHVGKEQGGISTVCISLHFPHKVTQQIHMKLSCVNLTVQSWNFGINDALP